MKQQSRVRIAIICLALLASGCGPERRQPIGTSGAAVASQTTTGNQPQSTGTIMASRTASPTAAPEKVVAAIQEAASPLTGSKRDYDPLMKLIGDAHFVLLGEATHGTKEFYEERARITQRLIKEYGFAAVVVEADWHEAYNVNQYVKGYTGGVSGNGGAEKALSGFKSFPQWMWANTSVRDFVQWLRSYNDGLPATRAPVGFYGLDLYSNRRSGEAVVEYLEQVDPQASQEARIRYTCMAPATGDEFLSAPGQTAQEPCDIQLQKQFEEMEQRAANVDHGMSLNQRDDLFSALQNARVAKNGTAYYEGDYGADMSSWKWRDLHMADTTDALVGHLSSTSGMPAKVVIWAHNSHVGDARATELGEGGEWNIGELMRERHKEDVVLVGFSTYTGTVIAARGWGEPGERKDVLPAEPQSDSALFHRTGLNKFLLTIRYNNALAEMLSGPKLQRAIGVVYYPRTELSSHYFEAHLSQQFDAIIHVDNSNAVEPLKH